ncbi:ComF family protein [Cronbergia sp. UHCC 0137]|uniref:ComF family protein n=1 Tax=Cronbergia sp. UHCC 0137 TaxID=3110239 RepID=UPI002B21A21E|nr:ComF family protein [Cronbergia sp. UHCC 0137]MEA5619683.1 ComF family protein [Cronbergia sp. UHCC 0137]
MLKNILSIFLEGNCPLCQRSTSQELCQYCLKQLQSCSLENPRIIADKGLQVFAWGMYGGCLKRAIAAMKYENRPQIGRLLGQFLGESWLLNSPQLEQKLVIVPIPLHPSKLKLRGYNQAAIIAQGFCETTGFKLKINGLERLKETKAQFGLSASDRESNLTEAFAVGKELRQHHPQTIILLIDDIYTTGATAKSAVCTLHESNIPVWGLASVAAAIKDRST